MTTPAYDTEVLQAATERLLDAVREGSPAVAEPSLLPGWTRGHVLTHLARNADALVNVLHGRPMYENAQARDADIEAGAARPLSEQYEDVRTTAAGLAEVMAGLTDAQWRETVALRNGVTDTADSIPFRRLVEVELHHVDLAVDYTLDELPGGFTDRAVGYLARRFSGRSDVPALELRAEDGRSWTTGALPASDGERLVVVGGPGALVGWLAGRSTGSGLTASAPLPTLPAL
ncbi:maleylpyruvate isomerase family mycothiol-dependent enzyme [Streptomyces sp. P38-E01]|uniref:Maleylpyruvate isomerase family mycothiol-dependent enzyme n=1 Tax=Streptomyces tardus TaxID=2780544 RepID=A0A949JQZ7_9ACTN|nr:maleylpyruvate isomerase family mycothiol-dependent enzyme [Streptomyces tardus]MBU7599656.1 maleylpyruvate isomerase family mycothiol-dependent enzyme [Streptomyces tardus]